MSLPVSGIESRHQAYRILREQEASGAFLKDLFVAHLGVFPAQDADLVRAICLGVVRNRRLLDFNLDAHAARGIKNAKLRVLLRIGAYQILFLSGIPDFAAVNTVVEVAKREFGKMEAGFANALLKAIAKAGLRAPEGNDLKSLAVRYSHPDWLVKRWHRELKPQVLEAALRRNNEEAPLWIRVNPRRASVPDAVAALASAGVTLEAHPGLSAEYPWFLRVADGAGKVLRSPAFAAGQMSFQDPVALWVVSLLDWRPGLSLLDACSAPGGKSALAIERAALHYKERGGESPEKARIVCGDLSAARLGRMRDTRERLGHAELLPVAADVAAPPFLTAFDRILVDAPCSNLGVLRRRPEARWHWTPEKTAALAAKQKHLLDKAAALLKPGGRLVYATCSAEAEETLDVVRDFLARRPDFSLASPGGAVPAALQKKECLWVYPGETEYDGFFAAALIRSA
ncbi:MAG: Sun protein [Fibrobacteria bacterium]|jgi:16S rRNA (cytosine967-C5)-methyltransferase|nr:Sun protein [Fibrobacteria bacterium]